MEVSRAVFAAPFPLDDDVLEEYMAFARGEIPSLWHLSVTEDERALLEAWMEKCMEAEEETARETWIEAEEGTARERERGRARRNADENVRAR